MPARPAPVLVTGATGFVGGRVVDALLEAGYTVRALVRETSDTSGLVGRDGVELCVGSLAPARGLDEAVSGTRAVVHCAGGGRAIGKEALFEANTRTTANLLDAVKREASDIDRFVLISSLAAHGPSPDGAPRDVDDAPQPVTWYGRSKVAAEQLVLAERESFPVTILRPPAIYGPGDDRMAPLFKWASRGVVPLPCPVRSTSMVHVDDCARAVTAILDKPHPSGRVYFVEDGGERAIDDVLGAIGDAVGRQRAPRRLPVPRALMVVVAAVVQLFARLARRRAFFNADKVRELTQRHWVCDSTPLQHELGWRPQIAFAQGASATARWMRREGLL